MVIIVQIVFSIFILELIPQFRILFELHPQVGCGLLCLKVGASMCKDENVRTCLICAKLFSAIDQVSSVHFAIETL